MMLNLHKQERMHTKDEINKIFSDPNIKLISFDIFDTLLCRPVLHPTDLFHIIEKKAQKIVANNTFQFSKLRVIAEKEARQKILSENKEKKWEDITLDEIYQSFVHKFEIIQEQAKKLQELEIETDLKYLQPRAHGKELYELAKRYNKKIYIISDVFYSGEVVERILHKNGFKDYDKCYVSSEYRLTKLTGSLYKKILQLAGVSPNNWVHIGDNPIGDMQKARENNIQTIYTPKAVNQFLSDTANFTFWNSKMNQLEPSFRMILGVVINKCFDNPYEQNNVAPPSLFSGDPEKFGYYAGGPALFFMTKWLMEESINKGYSTLHFVARDGYIPLKIFNKIKKYYQHVPESNYLFTSRMISHIVTLKNKKDIIQTNIKLPILPTVSVSTILKDRFLIEDPGIFKKQLLEKGYALDSPPKDINTFIKDCLDDTDIGVCIEKNINDLRKKIETYYKRIFDTSERHAIFDVGYTGQIQAALSQITGMNVGGFYLSSTFIPDNNFSENNAAFNFFGAPVNDRVHSILNRGVAENILSDSTIGSMIGLKGEGNNIVPVLACPESDQHSVTVQRKIQKGIIQFANDLVDLFTEDLLCLQVAPTTSFHAMSSYMQNPYGEDAKIYLDVKFENGSMGQGGYLVSKDPRLLGWRAGYDASFGNIKKPVIPKYIVDKKAILESISELEITEYTKEILWVDYAMVQDKYEFISQLSCNDSKMNIAILDAFKSPYKFKTKNVAVIQSPEEIYKCSESQFTVALPEDPGLCAMLQTFAAHYHFLLLERQDATYEQALSAVIQAYEFTIEVIKAYDPEVVLMWNEFYPLSRVTQYVCDMLNKKTMYLEYGLLPGTIQIDILGQVGESWISRRSKDFDSLKVDSKDIAHAKKTIEYLKDSGINRRRQLPSGGLEEKLKGINKKIILLAGHNNYCSGVFPYDVHAKRLHSPIFRDSPQLFQEISKIAQKNDWFVVYKPHPYAKNVTYQQKSSDHFLVIDNENINECVDLCDVIVTVLSQVSYVGLVRNKPVVMLGLTPLLDKGCSYEAFKYQDIALKIREALENQTTPEMQRCWVEHVARLLKYSLYYYDKNFMDKFNTQSAANFANKLRLYGDNDINDFSLTKHPFKYLAEKIR